MFTGQVDLSFSKDSNCLDNCITGPAPPDLQPQFIVIFLRFLEGLVRNSPGCLAGSPSGLSRSHGKSEDLLGKQLSRLPLDGRRRTQ